MANGGLSPRGVNFPGFVEEEYKKVRNLRMKMRKIENDAEDQRKEDDNG